MLGLAVMILAVAVLQGFKDEIIEKERAFNGDIAVYKHDLNNAYESSPFSMNADTLNQISKIEGVDQIQPYAIKPGIINVNEEVEGVVLKGIDSTYNQHYLEKTLVAGSVIDFHDSIPAQQQILISAYTADRLRLSVGDDFLMYFVQEPLRKRKFTIMGIYSLGVEEIDKTYVISAISLIRRLNNWSEDAVGGFEIRVNDFNQLDAVNQTVLDRLPITLFSSTVMEDFPEIFDWLALLDVNSQIILVLMVLVSIINMITALLIMILERTSMIGILKALGMNTSDIRRIFLYQAAFIIGIGLILGNALGGGLCLFQSYTHFFKLDESAYYVSFIPIKIGFAELIFLNVGTLLICLLALIIPSNLVSKIDPIEAIRFK